MKLIRTDIASRNAFTLLETIFSLSVGGFLLAGLILGFSTFSQVFSGVDDYYRATSDQVRVLDFIGQDLRRASSGNVTNNTTTLTLNLPDYLDPTQNPPIPRTATIAASGTVTYGSAGSQPTAVYTISGTAPNQTITRTYTPTTGAAATTTLTTSGSDFQFNCLDPGNVGSTANFSFGGAGQSPSVTVKISFQPKLNRFKFVNARTGTTLTSTILLRNHS